MKTNRIAPVLSTCICLMILTSCESHEQKSDEAFQQVKEKKTMLKDSVGARKEITPETKNADAAVKNTIPDAWAIFKFELERKILANEIKIKQLKGIPNQNAKLLGKVINIEKDNNDLRVQMDAYNAEVKAKWEKFKIQMNTDADGLSKSLKDLAVESAK